MIVRRLLCSITIALGAIVLVSTSAQGACITGGSASKISSALAASGVAELCQGAVFTVTTPINMTRNNSRIFTTGFPTNDAQKARIEVGNGASFNSPVIQARKPGAQIRNVVVDGRYQVLGHVHYRSLIAITGRNGRLENTTLLNSSGLSFVDAATDPSCSGLRIVRNNINGSGDHTAHAQWTDGIDVSCDNSYIAHNTVLDATDGGITIFESRNTVVEHNWVANANRSAFSGIIAATALGTDFTGTVIRNNLVQTCCGQHLHVALSVGAHLWCDDVGQNPDCQVGNGVSFLNNSGSGTFGFGLVVEGMTNATVQGNNLNVTPWSGQNCRVPGGNNYYVVDLRPGHASGSLQPGYSNRTNLHWPCIGPTNQ
ncbi:MAG: hypothetical protein AAF604_22275 [Acidobacteriota bacterium]